MVNPQATCSVRPSTTNGVPGKVAPITSMPLTPSASGACKRAKYQIAGALNPRCGSLASKGMPLLLRAPDTTQLLEPLPSMLPSSFAQRCMSRPMSAAMLCDSSGLANEVVVGALRYSPRPRYRAARSAVAAGCSPGYGGNSSHNAGVSMLCKAVSRANSLPQLPPRSNAIMSDQPTLSSGSQ
ncbi:hypothetical protein FQZ97_910380 [compost metagenome]